MKRFRKVYLEISNICNLHCSFCPGTERTKHAMTEDAFRLLISKLAGWTEYLYFHLMGEPLCHPKLEQFLAIAADAGFKVILTTNGTLLKSKQPMLLGARGLHKINISLHSFEANDISMPFQAYLDDCFSFAKENNGGCILCYRLWNSGGAEQMNRQILQTMKRYFPNPWVQERRGIRLEDRTYLEYGDKFDWPDLSAADTGENCFCYGLRDQIGILCDGTVVPCCLDHNGDIPLGNLLSEDLEQIVNAPRAMSIFNGFRAGKAVENLCRHCGYASRFRR